MRKILLALSAVVLLWSCKDQKEKKETTSLKTEKILPEIHTDQYGSYVGSFTDNEHGGDLYTTMSLNITHITSEGVTANSIVKGNNRPLSGTIKDSSGIYVLELKEPGDKKTDGVFHIVIKGDSISGIWTPYSKGTLKPKDLLLAKKSFVYNPKLMLPEDAEYIDYENEKKTKVTTDDGGTYVESVYRAASEAIFKLNGSEDIIPESELKNLKKIDLEILKNTIYARHGYAFKTAGARQFFDFVEWYTPVVDNVDKTLTETEEKNIATFNRFIKYAEDNYDTFGR